MTSWVIDSSVAFSWVHASQATAETDHLLEELEAGAEVVIPALWFAEVANSLLALQRRRKLTNEQRKLALQTLSSLGLTIDDEPARTTFTTTSDLAEKHGLTVYDATYLEVALRRGLALASRDASLLNVAKKCGVKVI